MCICLLTAVAGATAPKKQQKMGGLPVIAASCHPESKALHIAMTSQCPAQTWLDKITPWLFEQEHLVYLNVGANKGYNVCSMMQRMQLAENYTNHDWHKEMGAYMRSRHMRSCRSKADTGCAKTSEILCGVCHACRDDAFSLKKTINDRFPFRQLDIHALELLRENVEWLRWAFARFGIRASVLHAGASNATGETVVRHSKFGDEGSFIGTAAPVSVGSSAYESLRTSFQDNAPVRLISIDQYAREEGIKHIHVASVDAEGQDALILEGMRELLDAHSVDVFEFEYHFIGFWKKARSLEQILSWLIQHREPYRCYWQGSKGCLSPASPPCWIPAFEFRKMSNLVCVREGDGAPHQEFAALSNGCRARGGAG